MLPHAFAAGFLSTLVFHQGALTLLWLAGVAPRAPYDLHASAPLGVPAVLSLAFWGGVWGVVLWPLLRGARAGAYWRRAAVLGAVGPSAVALLVVFPLKGLPVAGGGDPRIVLGALLLNAAWGIGLALVMRVWQRSRDRERRPRSSPGAQR